MSILPGGITLIDDTYNANPSSLKAVLHSLATLAGEGTRVVVGLGDMLELGDETLPAHIEAGRRVGALKPYYFVALGDHAREMIRGALMAGLDAGCAVEAEDHAEMADKIRAVLKEGDLVFLKGSRRIGLDRVAEALKSSG
jgi:UDP-N-acetylmuramoyl-tripeptide--D-alanyl-D-alanine ligase